jgi:hypothetical protein
MRSKLTISIQHRRLINARCVLWLRHTRSCLDESSTKNRSIIRWDELIMILFQWMKNTTTIIESIILFVFRSEWISFILILEKTTYFRWFENFWRRLRSDTIRSFDLYEWTTSEFSSSSIEILWSCEKSSRNDSLRIRHFRMMKSNDLRRYWWSKLEQWELRRIYQSICDRKFSNRLIIWIIEFSDEH